MAEEGPCLGFKKKTVVMSCIGVACLCLVIWTILVTAQIPDPNAPELLGNLTNTTNSSQYGECTYNSSQPIEQVKLALLKDGEDIQEITRKNFRLPNADGKMAPLCKCFCKLNITEEMLVEALKFIKLNSTSPPLLRAIPLPGEPPAG